MTLRRPAFRISHPLPAVGFALALVAAFLYLVMRNKGLYPMVFADEWLYSSGARLMPFEKSTLPSYLYFGLYRLTNSCGAGFLDCARGLNALLFVGAAPFIYLLSKKVCPKPVALLLAVLSVIAPINSYTAYFMPEAMYFLAFFVFAWVALEYRAAPPALYGLATGALLGAMSLIKVHALFLLPALLAFMVYLCWAQYRGSRWLAKALVMCACAVLAMALVKMALGYLFAGRAGLSLFGNFYGTHANNSTGGALMKLLAPAWLNLKGHIRGLVLVMGVPFATIALHAFSARARSDAGSELRALLVFGTLMLGAVLGMTVLYTASIADAGPREALRLHLRYYDFVFPLLLMMAASPLALPEQKRSPALTALVALALGGSMLFAWTTLLPFFAPSFVDAPELEALVFDPVNFKLIVMAQLLILAIWIFHRRFAAGMFVCALLPVLAWNSETVVRDYLARSTQPSSYDKAGMLAHRYLTKDQTSKLAVAGEGVAGLLRALFHIDNPATAYIDLAPGTPLTRDQFSPHQDWMLVVGDHPLPADIKPAVKTPEFALVNIKVQHQPLARIEFARPLEGGVLAAAQGLAQPEPWGTWSNGSQVRLEFAAPLPKALNVLLTANAFGPNVGRDFVMTVGGQRKVFRLAGAAQDRFLQFDTDGSARTLTIDVPQPTSPRSVGQGADDRLLGIAIGSMEIGTRR